MTAPTHRQFSISWSLVLVILLYEFKLSHVNYYLAVLILLMVSKVGALFPDLDHRWQNIKEKTIPNFIINALIRVLGGKHRSWQTHSLDIGLILSVASYYVPVYLNRTGELGIVDTEIMILITTGFMCGWVSHLVADMFTPSGIRVFFFIGKLRLAFVPRKLLWISFSTATGWEDFVFFVSRILNCVLGVLCIIYPMNLIKI